MLRRELGVRKARKVPGLEAAPPLETRVDAVIDWVLATMAAARL